MNIANKIKIYKFLFIAFGFLGFFSIYYHEKIIALFHNTDQLFETVLLTTKITEFSIYALLINLLIILTIGLIEFLSIGWEKSSFYRIIFKRSKSTYGDIWCWLLTVLNLYDLFVLIFSFGFFYTISSILYYKIGEFNVLNIVDSVPIQLAIIFVAYDFKHFIWHWFMHKNPFWEFHKYHHSAEEFNLITSTRGHFIEKGFLTIFDAFLFIIFGLPAEYYIGMAFTREFYATLSHSGLNWNFGWIGKYILISPAAHRIHHSKEDKHFNKNFGSFFIWWDLMFGTYEYTEEPIEIGLENSHFNDSNFWKDMITGISLFFDKSSNIYRKNNA